MCQITSQTFDSKTLILVSTFNMLLAVSALETASNQQWVHEYTCLELGLQCNSFLDSTNMLAINQARIHCESGEEAALCHPPKHEESCLTSTSVLLQGVVTYMSCVETFATGNKIESSDQSPFWGPIKVTSKLLKSIDRVYMAAI